uniref:Hepatocyte growth factor-regulated tyrosine kinase substrate n=1 Tax=Panagrolaimus sp. ES5 TaxID=591445 RepID=A0AC34GXG7_9BILA
MSKQFERTLEAATDQVVVDTDWSGIMECIDMVRGKDVSAKDAASAISRRLKNSNPNIVHHTLVLLEACMKNCGTAFHAEIMSTRFLDQLKDIVITSSPGKVQEKILELIQIWHSAFAKRQEYAAISDVHRILKHHGYKFPAAKESDAMFAAQCAPDWVDGDQCFRCRSEFGIFNRKHHCRACGQIFCDRCSSHQLLLPQFGIEKKVRVCDTCFEKNNKKIAPQNVNKDNEDEKRRQKELEDKEEEELALAIALSQSDAEHKKSRGREWTPAVAETPNPYFPAPPASNDGNESIYKGAAMSVVDDRLLPGDNLSVDSNLAHYLNRDYWQKKSTDTSANAPPPSDISYASIHNGMNNTFAFPSNNYADITKENVEPVFSLDPLTKKVQNLTMDEDEAETGKTKSFCDHIREKIDTMDNRMRSNLMRNRSIVNDSSIHGLFVQLTDMHGDVLERLNTLENDREYFERLQDHLAHIQESRQAVNALREEHERQRQERLLAEQRERQAQMQQKLSIMQNDREYFERLQDHLAHIQESRQAVNALREEHERQRQERLLAEQRERQAQMQQKLSIMRIKKQEMILHQRQLALQRFQEQEQNMQQRKTIAPQYSGYPENNYPTQSTENNMPGNYYGQPMMPPIMNPQPIHPGHMLPSSQSMTPQPMTSQTMLPTHTQGMPFSTMPPQQYMMLPQHGYNQFPPQHHLMYMNPNQPQHFYPSENHQQNHQHNNQQ